MNPNFKKILDGNSKHNLQTSVDHEQGINVFMAAKSTS